MWHAYSIHLVLRTMTLSHTRTPYPQHAHTNGYEWQVEWYSMQPFTGESAPQR